MLSTRIKVHFLIVMSLANGLRATSESAQCSCYTFSPRADTWLYGRDKCRTQGGDLVSMETVDEWEFIKIKIQTRTVYNEWWIGLEKREGRWLWLSNHPLKYHKWQPNEPSKRDNEKCVIIAKNYPQNTYGLLSDTRCDVWRGWICEQKRNNCSSDQVQWCNNSVTPTTTITTTTTSSRKTATIKTTISKTKNQTTAKKTTTDLELNNPSPSRTTTKNNKDQSEASESLPTTPDQKYTETSTTAETDNGKATDVSLTAKKPFPTLIIIIVALVAGLVVFVCCVVLCFCSRKRKRKGKAKPRLQHDGTNTENCTSDVMAGSSSVAYVNQQEMKVIVINPNNACAQENSHATTHWNAFDNTNVTKEVTKSSHGCLVSQMNHDAKEVRDHSNMTSLEATGKDPNRNKTNCKSPQEHMDLTPDDTVGKENTKVMSDIYATVDKSKKMNKTKEAVYAEVKNPADMVTYAELEDFNHDATRSVPKAPPPYHPTEYASVSTMQDRFQAN